MAEIKPKIIDGEPMCNIDCPLFRLRECEHRMATRGCFYGVRQQRDEALVELAKLRQQIAEMGLQDDDDNDPEPAF